MSVRDRWPTLPSGEEFDGRQTRTLARSDQSPFGKEWDVLQLVQEIEQNLSCQVMDIPFVYKGSNNYGFHMRLSNRQDIIARLARGDVNMPDYDGFPIDAQIIEVKFEVAVYVLLCQKPPVLASRLLYHRLPVQHDGPKHHPQNIYGRRLLVFERAEGENNVWYDLTKHQQNALLAKTARIRAALFNLELPIDFAGTWLHDRLFEQKPESIAVEVAPMRKFCIALFTAKIHATIKNIGDMIGWEDDNNTVGPAAARAKQSLLRYIPQMLPQQDPYGKPYRLVLEHGDFGVHNMSIAMDADNQPAVPSVYDWETGCIAPAILSDPLMAVTVDLVTDDEANPAIIRVEEDTSPANRQQYMDWAMHYTQHLFKHAPDYESAIKAGRDARYLWFALRDWRGDDPEQFFGNLGAWAEREMEKMR